MKQIKLGIVFLLLSTVATMGQFFDAIVDASGAGDYTTVQAAIDAVTEYNSSRTLIFVKRGTYTEKVWVDATKANVSLIGEDVESVSIEWDDYQGKNEMSGADSYTFLAEGDGLYMENITVKNTAGPVGQAVAIRTIGDKTVFKNCQFLGNQDTYYAHKDRQYNYKCTVEGNTDFIYGDATCVFDSCTIRSIAGGSYITAPADAKIISKFTSGDFYHGLLFRYCNVEAGFGVNDESVYLGRPWQPNSASVFIYCTLGAHIKSVGWSEWNDNNHLSSNFAEYKSKDESGNLIDVTNRVSWSSQLADDFVEIGYYDLPFFLSKSYPTGLWDPIPVLTPLYDPQNVALSVSELSWDAVVEAVGYVIYENGQSLGFSATTSFTLDTPGSLENYKVVSVSANGALSDGTVTSSTGIKGIIEDGAKINYQDGTIFLSQKGSVEVYNLSGSLILSDKECTSLSIKNLNTGVYLVKAVTLRGYSIIKKIVVK